MKDLTPASLPWFSICRIAFISLLLAATGPGFAEDNVSASAPFTVPVKLDKPGVPLNMNFVVVDHLMYTFRISYHFTKGNQKHRNDVVRIIGGRFYENDRVQIAEGKPIRVRLVIQQPTSTGNRIVYEKDLVPSVTSWSSDRFSMNIGYCDLRPGRYNAALEVVSASSEYETLATTFSVITDKHKTKLDPNNLDRSKSCPH